MPRFGFKQLKKRLNSLDVKPVKVKAVDRQKYAFATFRNEEERDDAIIKINGHVWKDRTLFAKKASATADPLLKKRKTENTADQPDEKKMKTEEEMLPPDVRLKNSVMPLWNISYEEQLKTKYDDLEGTLRNLANQIEKNNSDYKAWVKEQRKLYDGKCCELLPIKSSPVTEGYRNKCEFTIGKDADGQENTVGFRFGQYRDGTSSVGEPYDLAIIPESMKRVVKHFQDFIRSSEYTSYNPETHLGYWRLLTVRSCCTDDLLITVDFHPQQLDCVSFLSNILQSRDTSRILEIINSQVMLY